MTKFNYSLDQYTWRGALLWGNFTGHCKKALKSEGSLGNRLVHASIAATQLLPIVSQIASVFEKVIVENLRDTGSPSKPSSPSPLSSPLLSAPVPLLQGEVREAFSSVNSRELVPLNGRLDRSGFWGRPEWPKWPEQPVVLSHSKFVSPEMVEHLMRNKK